MAGRGRYVANLVLPGMLHMKVARSPHASARIRAVDVRGAAATPGVLGAFSGADLATTKPMPVTQMVPGLRAPERRPLATDRVCTVGEPVAVVVAVDPRAAEDALERIEVDYEPGPAVTDPVAALAPDAPLVHPELGTNVAYAIATGPPGARLTGAEIVVRQRMVNQRLIPSPMETRGVVADHRPFDGALTVYLSTQGPHIIRSKLAELLDLPENAVRVVAGDVGGAFGSKFNLFPEEVLAALMSRHFGRPVRWIEERSESTVASSHGRGMVADVEAGATRDGTLTALHVRLVSDLGAHVGVVPPTGGVLTATMISGAYAIPEITFDVQGVFTNTTPIDPYRGYYRAEAAYFIERTVDLVAHRLGLDPVVVRRRNLVRPEALPFATATGELYDSGEYEALLDAALELADHAGWRREQARRRLDQARPRRSGRYLGVGVASYVWRAAFPSGPRASPGIEFLPGGWETASVRVERGGGVTVRTGACPHGQGLAAGLAVVVSEALGVDPGDVTVVAGDTEAAPYGIGSAGSRSMVVAGSAVWTAARRVRQQATALAAHLLEAAVDDLAWEGREVHVVGVPSRRIDLYELGRLAAHGDRPPGMAPCLEAWGDFDPEHYTYPSGVHVCVVEVDPETGAVDILRHVAVDDCGRPVVPTIVEGQVHGGTAQGIGQALLEEAAYDDDGQLRSGSFASYAVPSAVEVPRFVTALRGTPTTRNPLGVKGAGEAGAIGAPPAVVNAVVDALAPFGVDHLDMPLTPERVWRAVHASARRRSD